MENIKYRDHVNICDLFMLHIDIHGIVIIFCVHTRNSCYTFDTSLETYI